MYFLEQNGVVKIYGEPTINSFRSNVNRTSSEQLLESEVMSEENETPEVRR
jgi:hypothetical protein